MKKNYSNENDKVDIARIEEKVIYIERTVTTMNEKLDSKYITNDRFGPIEKIVYGMVTLILVGFVTAIVKFFIIK